MKAAETAAVRDMASEEDIGAAGGKPQVSRVFEFH